VKAKFNAELHDIIDRVPARDVLTMLGVSTLVLKAEEEWQGVIGKRGLDKRNEVSEEFTVLCNGSVEEHLVSEEGNALLDSHMIDRFGCDVASQRACCKDVQVMGGASCWTDHNLVRAKLNIDLPRARSSLEERVVPFSVPFLSSSAVQEDYS